MFVLLPVEDISTPEEPTFIAWVCDGTVHRGDVATWEARVNVTNGRHGSAGPEVQYELDTLVPVNIAIRKIVKHTEWDSMARGFSGAFVLSEKPFAPRQMPRQSGGISHTTEKHASAEFKHSEVSSQTYLFDSRTTADIYFAALPLQRGTP